LHYFGDIIYCIERDITLNTKSRGCRSVMLRVHLITYIHSSNITIMSDFVFYWMSQLDGICTFTSTLLQKGWREILFVSLCLPPGINLITVRLDKTWQLNTCKIH